MGFDKGYKQLLVATVLVVALGYCFVSGLMDHLFPEILTFDPDTKASKATRMVQLFLYLAAYGFILFSASNLLSEGAELLLLIPSVSGLVGSVVLPVLGAVPDGAIVLFSMLGTREMAAKSISVGVGALAGSTVMLLTIPWGLCVISGRVSINAGGVANYNCKPGHRLRAEDSSSLMNSGVQPTKALRGQALVMLLTSISYVVLLLPMALHHHLVREDKDGSTISEADKQERLYAIIATVTSVAGLLLYLVYCVRLADSEAVDEKVKLATVKAMNNAFVSLTSLFDERGPIGGCVNGDYRSHVFTSGVAGDPHFERKFEEVVRSEFRRYDADGNGTIDTYELGLVMKDLGEDLSPRELRALAAQMDENGDGVVSFEEFMAHVKSYALAPAPAGAAARTPGAHGGEGSPLVASSHVMAAINPNGDEEGGAEEEEEADAPEDLASLPVSEQRFYILVRSFWQMGLGLVLVLFFSDPMVEVFTGLGEEFGIPAFYVSFVLAPLASNASELIASMNYASKKTQKTITIALQALLGAGSMNNTFCLSVFTAILWLRGFAWEFTAETVSILVVEAVMVGVSFLPTQRTFVGVLVLLLFPMTIGLVAFLEKVLQLN